MASKPLTREERGVISAHEAGMHDKKPIPTTCSLCEREAAVAASKKLVELSPEPPKTARAAKKLVAAVEKKDEPLTLKADEPTVVIPPSIPSRESWLIAAVEELKPLFEAAEAPVVPVRVSVGWPAGRSAKANTIGQCFQSPLVADGVPNIFISPVLTDPVRVLDVLVHELVHSIVPVADAPHRGAFVKLAKKVGLEGPWTATKAGEELKAYLVGIADKLGPFTHAKVSKGIGRKVQSTRMLKVECQDCGCVIRMTRKWLDDAGAPTCGCGGEMAQA